jgi:hypothetical protein
LPSLQALSKEENTKIKRQLNSFKNELSKQITMCKKSKDGKEILTNLTYEIRKIFGYHANSQPLENLFMKTEDINEMFHIAMANFLLDYETEYLLCVDSTCYLLIANGHDLLDIRTRKYSKSIEEINKVDPSLKLAFLHEHGIDIFEREEDRRLRNKIAHQQFGIAEPNEVKKVMNELMMQSVRLSFFIERILDAFFGCL